MASGDTKTEALLNALENGGDIDGIAGCCNTNLQNYIIDSMDLVLNAKDAVQNKGGTVDYDGGLASLVDEINSIPSSGGQGTFEDNPSNNIGSGATKTKALLSMLENGGDISSLDGSGNSRLQNYLVESINLVDAAKNAIVGKGGTVGNTGLAGLAEEIDSIPAGGGDIEGWGRIIYLDGDELKTVTIQNSSEYDSLCSTSIAPLVIDGVSINKANVKKVELGTYATYTNDYFCNALSNLEEVTGTKNLQSIGTSFLASRTSLNCDIDLSNVEIISSNCLSDCTSFNGNIKLEKATVIQNGFLRNCTSFNQPINIPDTIIELTSNFMRGCTTFNQPLIIPNSVTAIGQDVLRECSSLSKSVTLPNALGSVGSNFMHLCDSFTGPLVCNSPSTTGVLASNTRTLATTNANAPMYVAGVTLTGPYANIWKSRYADRTSSPYRKLIASS